MASPSPSSPSSSSYSSSSPSSSSLRATTPTDNEQPCCSRYLSTTAPSTSTSNTAENTNRAAKRKFDQVDGSSETDGSPRKCARKTRHTVTTSPSRGQKKRRSPSSSPQPQKRLKVPLGFRTPEAIQKRKILNTQYLRQLQQECYQAAAGINVDTLVAADVWNSIIQNTPENRNPEPIVLFKRLLRNPTRLHWGKLTKALSMLTTAASTSSPSRLGALAAKRATRWVKGLFQQLDLNANTRSRHLICGSTFTHLCGQALAAQRAPILPINSSRLTPTENQMCFLSGDDFSNVSADPTALSSEHAVVYLRHPDGPRNTSLAGRNGQYPITDFEEPERQNNQ